MRLILIITMVIILISFVNADFQDVFVLTLHYDSGKISVESLFIEKGYFEEPVQQPEDGYLLEIISSENKIIYYQRFKFNFEEYLSPPLSEWFDESGNQIYIPNNNETIQILENTTAKLILPYFNNARLIKIKEPSGLVVVSIPLNQKASILVEETKDNQKGTTNHMKKISILVIFTLILVVIIWLVFKARVDKSNNY